MAGQGESNPASAWSWPFWGGEMWRPIVQPLAPQTLTQPIQPGWTFGNVITVTERNSSSPETEREIVAEESYGRQLGRMLAALAVLIEERPETGETPKALEDLLELRDRIERIKLRTAAERLERIECDLARLKAELPDDYYRIAARLARDADAAPDESA